MQALLSRADISPMWGTYDPILNSGIHSPLQVSGLSAWYDTSDLSSLVYDGSNRTSLAADKSGNSAVNVLAHNASGTGNSATTPSLAALGTGNFTLAAEIMYDATSAGGDQSIIGAPAATDGLSFSVKVSTQRVQAGKAGVGYVSATNGTNLAPLTWIKVAYVRSGTTGTYYINGVADGTATDNYDYTAFGITSYLNGNASVSTGMKMRNARIYSVALSAAEVLADANGTVQANCVRNVDFTLAPKLATSFTAVIGGTVTINTSGATGARICGARDLYQGTVANQPVLTIGASNYMTLDGSNDYVKAAAFALPQPITVYLVGSQISWVINRYIFDGGMANNTIAFYQSGATPKVGFTGGSVNVAENSNWAVGVTAVATTLINTTASAIRINRTAATTGNVNRTADINGFTLCSRQDGVATTNANVAVSEVLIYSGAHSTITQDRIILMLGRKWKIAV